VDKTEEVEEKKGNVVEESLVFYCAICSVDVVVSVEHCGFFGYLQSHSGTL